MKILKPVDKPVNNSTLPPVAWYYIHALTDYKKRIVYVRRVGDSLVITIPAMLARRQDLQRGDEVLFSEFKTGLSVTKLEYGAKRHAYQLD